MGALRETVSAAGLVTARRARRDVTLLVAWATLVAFVVVIAVEGPHLLIDTVDRGARQAVARAGDSADILATTLVGQRNASSQVPVLLPREFQSLAAGIPGRLPASISAVYRDSAVTVLGPQTPALRVNGTTPAADLDVQVGMLTPANASTLHLVSGRLPPASTASSSETDVVLSSAAARASGLAVGSTLTVGTFNGASRTSAADRIELRVVGIVGERVAAAAQWRDMPNLWTPSATIAAQAVPETLITVLTRPDGVAALAPSYRSEFTGRIRIRLDADAFTAARERTVDVGITRLVANSHSLVGNSEAVLTVSSGFDAALAGFPSASRAALAQMSLLIAGVLGVAAAVVILLSRLLVFRRRGETMLERARGSSLAAIGTRSLLESFCMTVAGTAVGIGVAHLVRPGPPVDVGVLILVVLVALFATPVQTVVLVRTAWSVRRIPANRRDRAERSSRTRALRLAAEITVVALGIAALASVGSRGLLQTSTTGIDPFLASAPLLFAIVVTVIVLRIYPWPVRALAALGKRQRGVIGLVGATRATALVAVIPVFALTLAVALVVSGGLLVASVNAGQVTASWQRTGADVRVNARVSDSEVATIATAPGVRAAASARVDFGVQTKLGTTVAFPTLIAIDTRFRGVVDRLPAGTLGGTSSSSLRALDVATKPSAALPVVVSADLAKLLITKNIAMYYGPGLISLHVVGVTDLEPNGYLAGPFLYVDRAALDARLPTAVKPNLLLIMGPGASRAAAALHEPAPAVHSRTTWLAARRSLALIAGTQNTMLLATAALALLAAIALISTVLSGSRERGRSVSLLRTLGMRAGLGWWLALAELTPVIVAALVGGTAGGVAMVVLLEPSLGLDVLAGGESIPPTVIPPLLIAGLAAAVLALLGLSVLIEVLAHRHDKLSEVLRAGETV